MTYINTLKKIFKSLFTLLTLIAALTTQIFIANLPQRDIYPKAEDAVRVMSFNLLSERFGSEAMNFRTGIVSQTIAEYYPDSFGVQEATGAWMLSLKNRLPEYDYVGRARSIYPLDETCAVFYLKDKYELLDSGTFWLSETPQKISRGWDGEFARVCSWVLLENKKTGETYAHLNTHLDHRGPIAREKSIDLILDKAESFGPIPVVITGDFNFRENSSLYKAMTADAFADTKFLAPDTMHSPTYHNFKPPEEQNPDIVIDFIFVSKNIQALKYKVITEGINGRPVSDHYPLYSDLLLNAGEGER
ncbi:MAG: endonuclease/exonuclease/phosphatase family protein [Clostridiales bacterium]|nr:endonuclease/exonuclease/phosphatase family protein [Clostridiales bacterium]